MANFNIDYLVIAGGGAGGVIGGGGGAGGFRTSFGTGNINGGLTTVETSQNLTTDTPYTLIVGAGGIATNTPGNSGPGGTSGSGGNSSFAGSTTVLCTGGGGGGNYNYGVGGSGGSGGGGSSRGNSIAGGSRVTTPVQGFNGGNNNTSTPYPAGGGGGAARAGGANTSAGSTSGGTALASSITGTPILYAGGGGGGYQSYYSGGINVSGGGGGASDGAASDNATNAIANTGSGGGGGGFSTNLYYGKGGNGGSGIVILRYATSDVDSYTTTGITPTEDTTTIPGQTILSFTTVGTGTITFTPLPPPTPFDGTRATTPVTGFNKTSISEGLKLPSGDNSNQPVGALAEQGMIRNDTEETVDSSASAITHYNGTNWRYFAATQSPDPPTPQMYLDAGNTNSYPGTGSTWFDLTTNANNGAITGATWNSGGYFDFDGINDYVEVPLNLQNTAFSISFWAKDTLDSNNGYIIANDSGSAQAGWLIGGANGGGTRYNFRINNGSSNYLLLDSGAVDDTVWHYVVVTWDNTTNANGAKIYINGSLSSQGTSTSTTNFSFTNSHTRLMCTFPSGSYHSNGLLSKVRFYNTEITQTEIDNLYNEGR